MADEFEHFVTAQADVYDAALKELRAGRKTGHWMWFIFPQLSGLGTSLTAYFYAIADRADATQFLEHPVLGPRLRQCVETVLGLQGVTAHDIFGYPDELKFRSCLTLFETAAPDGAVFARALDKYFAGERDPLTLQRL